MYRLGSKKCHFIYLPVNKLDKYSRAGFSSVKPLKFLNIPLKCLFVFRFASHVSLLENKKLLLFSLTYLIGEKVGLKKKITRGPHYTEMMILCEFLSRFEKEIIVARNSAFGPIENPNLRKNRSGNTIFINS